MRRIVVTGLAAAACLLHLVAPSLAAPQRTNKIVALGQSVIEVIEEGAGPLIVLIPSTGRGSDDLDAFAAELAKGGYRVLRPQPRGVGRSTGPMTEVTYHDFAADIAGVIRQAGDGPAVVAGHAYGNWIARTVAADYPDLVRGVVLVASGAKNFPSRLSDEITIINDPGKSAAERLKALQVAFFAPGHDASSWLEGWYPEVTRSQRTAGAKTDRASWWAGGKAPMLDLLAADDPFRPADTRNELKEAFGDRVTLRVIPDASHALPSEKPAETARNMLDWIGGL